MGENRYIFTMKLLTGFPWLPIELHPYTSADMGGAEKQQKRSIYSNRTVKRYNEMIDYLACRSWLLVYQMILYALCVSALYSIYIHIKLDF